VRVGDGASLASGALPSIYGRRIARSNASTRAMASSYFRTRGRGSKNPFFSTHKKQHAAREQRELLLELHYVRDAMVLSCKICPDAEKELGRDSAIYMELSHNRFRSIWMIHFYGHQGYRKHLRTAVKGLIALSMRSVRVRGETHEVYQKACASYSATLRSALDTQLDWSLDDLELNASEQEFINRDLYLGAPAPLTEE